MNRKYLVALLCASGCAVPLSPAFAQVPPVAPPDNAPAGTPPQTAAQTTPTPDANAQAADENGVPTIVVTAQRRSENLQNVPISITAVTAKVADQMGVVSPETITQVAPGVTFTRQAQGGAPFIRGVGSSSTFIGNEPSVALFVDDVYLISGTASVFDFNNIEAIEILKGPQGTLFGRNATGGVIHVRTRNPTHEPTFDVSATYGNYNTVNSQGYFSAGLSDNIAFNIAGFYTNQQEGWGRNFAGLIRPTLKSGNITITPGTLPIYRNNAWGVRGKILIEPGPDTTILLEGSHSYRHSDEGIAMRTVPGFRGRGGYTTEVLGGGFYDGVDNVYAGGYTTRLTQFSAKITQDLHGAKLVSISSYGKLRSFAPFELDASPGDFLDSYNPYGADTYTQEVQLLSPEHSRLTWIVGAFYMHDKDYFQGFFSGPAITGSPPSAGTIKYQTNYAAQVTSSYSGFAQATLEVFERTNVTAGVRYTSDHRATANATASLRFFDDTPVTGTVRGPFSDHVVYGAVTSRLSIDHHFSDNLMGYVAYNHGFKSGVYNIAGYGPAVTAFIPPVKPETINAYTAGFKSEFFDRMVRLNVEGYYYDYKNIQVQNNRPDGTGGTIFVNGGAAKIKGVDIDLSVVPVHNLTLTAGANIQQGHYTKFDNGPTFFPTGANAPIAIPSGCNFTVYPVSTSPEVQILRSATDPRSCSLAGNKTVLTPPFTLSLSAAYHIPMGKGGLDLATSWLHSGNYFFEPDNLSFTRQPLYDVVNASIKFTTQDGHVSLRLWGNNLTKTKYYAYIANSATSGTKYSPSAPRTYGMTLGFHF